MKSEMWVPTRALFFYETSLNTNLLVSLGTSLGNASLEKPSPSFQGLLPPLVKL